MKTPCTCQYLILLQFVMPKSKIKFGRNPDSWQCNRRLCSRASRWQFSTKNSITSDAATCRKKRPRSQGSRKPLSQRMARFIDGHQKQGWVGASDSFERRMADVAESFVNRRVQFCQLWTNAAQITFDNNNTDNEQVSCVVYQGQTQHMNNRIKSVDFLWKSKILVTPMAWQTQNYVEYTTILCLQINHGM